MGIRSIGRTCDSRATSFAEPFNSAAFRLFLSPARRPLKGKEKEKEEEEDEEEEEEKTRREREGRRVEKRETSSLVAESPCYEGAL